MEADTPCDFLNFKFVVSESLSASLLNTYCVPGTGLQSRAHLCEQEKGLMGDRAWNFLERTQRLPESGLFLSTSLKFKLKVAEKMWGDILWPFDNQAGARAQD